MARKSGMSQRAFITPCPEWRLDTLQHVRDFVHQDMPQQDAHAIGGHHGGNTPHEDVYAGAAFQVRHGVGHRVGPVGPGKAGLQIDLDGRPTPRIGVTRRRPLPLHLHANPSEHLASHGFRLKQRRRRGDGQIVHVNPHRARLGRLPNPASPTIPSNIPVNLISPSARQAGNPGRNNNVGQIFFWRPI